MRIIIAGGDGYCGWATALHLSRRGHEVAILDNLIPPPLGRAAGRADADPLAQPARAGRALADVSGKRLQLLLGDLGDTSFLRAALRSVRPDAFVHFAEQRSAPWSMIDFEHALSTERDNVLGTLGLVWLLREELPACHLVKLGTMGEYGTPGIDIEEGWLNVQHNGRSDCVLFPKRPGSIYHLSKVHDSHNIEVRLPGLGPRRHRSEPGRRLWRRHRGDRRSTTTSSTASTTTRCSAPCSTASASRRPSATRSPSMERAARRAASSISATPCAASSWRSLNPARAGEYRVMNQFTEQFTVLELAERVRAAGAELGLQVAIDHLPNPRVEAEAHHYNARHTALADLGLKPHLLSRSLLDSLLKAALRFRDRVEAGQLQPTVDWRRGRLRTGS